MSMMRSDPFREADRLFQQLVGASSGSGPGAATAMAVPIDAYRKGDAFMVQLDLPGVDRDSIDVTVEKNVVTVRAERRGPWAQDVEAVVRERAHGAFSRQLFMGENLDTDAIEADYTDGVLRLTIPMHPAAKARRIQVAAGGSPKRVGEGSGAPA
jgi:HSP20 family protein